MRLRPPAQTQLWLALGLMPGAACAITLQDFTPRADQLTPRCNAVYTSTIPGCSSADFENAAPCSPSCVQAMRSLNTRVIQACTGDARNYQFIVAAFLDGDGIQNLCPNVVVETANPTSQPSRQPDTSSQAQSKPLYTTSAPTPSSTSSTTLQPASPSSPYSSSSSSTSPAYSSPSPDTTSSRQIDSTSSSSSPSQQPSSLPTPSLPTPVFSSSSNTQTGGAEASNKESCGSPFNWCATSGATSLSKLASYSVLHAVGVLAFICMGKLI